MSHNEIKRIVGKVLKDHNYKALFGNEFSFEVRKRIHNLLLHHALHTGNLWIIDVSLPLVMTGWEEDLLVYLTAALASHPELVPYIVERCFDDSKIARGDLALAAEKLIDEAEANHDLRALEAALKCVELYGKKQWHKRQWDTVERMWALAADARFIARDKEEELAERVHEMATKLLL